MENLASKYRPKDFNDISEQTVVTEILEKLCQQEELTMRNFLFIGPAGTGKTTSARALANKLNDNKGEIIELDAASHSGVDSIRTIIDQARQYPIGCKYKIFIIDECFHKNTLVDTPDGPVRISDIRPGDVVNAVSGTAKVANVFANVVHRNRLILVHTDNGPICTTIDHKFLTSEGWKLARELTNKDRLVTYHNASETRTFPSDSDSICDTISLESCKNADAWATNHVISTCTFTESKTEFVQFFGHEILSDHHPLINMYDLQIDGYDPIYYVNGSIVHNCHALSNAAWSALLKTLEEQPARTIMALCTTNPEKIPPTILSRVQVFQLTKISLKGIEDRLKYIVDSEIKEGRDIKYDDEVINYIAKLSGGGMRDAITNLEQCLTYSTDLSVKVVMDALNLPNYDDYFNLLNGVAKKDNQTVIRIINDVYNSGVNFVKWFEGFHGFICNIVKYIFLQDISATMIPSHYLEKISKYGPNHSALCLRLANKLVDMNQELKTTQYLQELAITYLCDSSNPKKENK